MSYSVLDQKLQNNHFFEMFCQGQSIYEIDLKFKVLARTLEKRHSEMTVTT